MSNFISRWSDRIDNKLGAAFNRLTGHQSAAERRAAANAMNDQIKAYKEQSELSRQQTEATRNEQNIQKRRIEEKQIRTLRNNYRSQGIMGAGSTSNNLGSGGADTSNKLGG